MKKGDTPISCKGSLPKCKILCFFDTNNRNSEHLNG